LDIHETYQSDFAYAQNILFNSTVLKNLNI
jgi:hypothetical protein